MKINSNLLILIILAITISLLIIPTTIWVFSISNWISTTGTDLKKSDWLSFWGSFLSYFGTITLGAIALWHNHKLFEVNRKLVELSTIAQFYSDIEPAYLEIEKKETDNPFEMLMLGGTRYSQKLVKLEESTKKVTGLWLIRFGFKIARSCAPNSYNVESCQIYLDNANGETQKSIIGYCIPTEKDEYFMLPHKNDSTIKDGVLMSVVFVCQEDDNKVWEEFTKAEKLNMKMRFKYKNSFDIKSESFIGITWTAPTTKGIFKKFKATEYLAYQNNHYLNQK